MRVEFEIEKRDLDDYDKILEIQSYLNESIEELSEAGKKFMSMSIYRLKNCTEHMKEEWLVAQRDRVGSLLRQHLNPKAAPVEDE